MTLIALHVHPDGIDVLTDTLCYSDYAIDLGSHSKIRLFPHLDAAVMVKGPGGLGSFWTMLRDNDYLGGFDDWHTAARDELPGWWKDTPETWRTGPGERAWVYHLGYSHSRGRFIAYEYDSADGFTGRDLTDAGLFTNPAADEPPQPPASDEDWANLGFALYRENTSATRRMAGQGTFIGGDLTLTRLRRGESTQRRVMTLTGDVDDYLFRRMMIGTLHPLGQLGPCPCGSGQPYAVCHLRNADPDHPCPCGREGATWGGCHRVDLTGPQAIEHFTRYRDDYADERDELAAAWRDAMPDDDAPPPPQIIPA